MLGGGAVHYAGLAGLGIVGNIAGEDAVAVLVTEKEALELCLALKGELDGTHKA